MAIEADQVIGRHVLIRRIGRGACGEVWLAHHELGERAMKFIVDLKYRRQLYNEAKILGRLDHSNIVRVIDREEAHDPPYCVMEYVPGGNLRDKLNAAKGKRLGLRETWLIVSQILRALEHAHSRGIYHCDLKPENILLNGNVAKVADFGFGNMQAEIQSIAYSRSVARDDGTRIGGTILYMSPQQLAGSKPDASDDLYAAGVMMCEMLTGFRPRPVGVGRMIENVGVDARITHLLLKAMEEEPADRFHTATSMLRAFEEVIIQEKKGSQLSALLYRFASVFQRMKCVALRESVTWGGLAPSPLRRTDNSGFPANGQAMTEHALVVAAGKPRRTRRNKTDDLAGKEIRSSDVHTEVAAFARPRRRISRRVLLAGSATGFSIWIVGHRMIKGRFPFVHDPTLARSLGFRFAHIEPGVFVMGSAPREPGRRHDETQHNVRLTRPFDMAIHPVTRDQFAAFIEDTGYKTASERADWKPRIGRGAPQGNHPVVQVRWEEAIEFCAWLTGREGRKYRLPTEAEWEYACRATTKTLFNTGASLRSDQANFSGSGTTPVGLFAPNAWGLFDMHGNVWQWCADEYAPYPTGAAIDPKGQNRNEPRSGHVLRGGSWLGGPLDCRSAERSSAEWMRRDSTIGFRIVRDID